MLILHGKKTNRLWFSKVCTLIDNDTVLNIVEWSKCGGLSSKLEDQTNISNINCNCALLNHKQTWWGCISSDEKK